MESLILASYLLKTNATKRPTTDPVDSYYRRHGSKRSLAAALSAASRWLRT